MAVPDRLIELAGQDRVTGIDYIHVDRFTQTHIDIHFLRDPGSLADSMVSGSNALVDSSKIKIYQPAGDVPDKSVTSLSWWGQVLQLQVDSPGDFTLYKLRIDDDRMDPFYNDVLFDFKANCPSDLDCKPSPHECPPEELVDFPVDYLARDFDSYKQALLEFASVRFPDWPDRLEADAGIMLAEIMSAIGDEMSYYQDRISREAYLETATQRRSLRRHARLVDYNLHDGLGANVWLAIETDVQGPIPAGTNVYAKSDTGKRILFEVGQGIVDQKPVIRNYAVDDRLNSIAPHIWDEDAACLPVGSTELYVKEEFEGILDINKWILLQTRPLNPAQSPRAHLVKLISVENAVDPVMNIPLTRLTWAPEHATIFEMDITVLKVHGNILPATAGETKAICFITGGEVSSFTVAEYQALRDLNTLIDPPFTVERRGRKTKDANGKEKNLLVHLFTLPGSEQQPIVRVGDDPFNSQPDIYLEELVFDGANWIPNNIVWEYCPSFVGIDSADPGDRCFSLEDGAWRKTVTYQRPGTDIVHKDYASDAGITIRFGDSEFGRTPAERSVFRVHYRLGNGKWDNVAADTLQSIEQIPGLNLSVTNPLPARNGMDAQNPAELRQLAPDAFKAVTYRAVRPEDYAEAAERLNWVQRAGANFRWTGSWLSAFVTPDPLGTVVLPEMKKQLLLEHLNRFRQAGREVHVLHPVYANLDIEIEICAMHDAFGGQVKERVIHALLGKNGMPPTTGYFSSDHFTFGTPLYRSTLEAAIHKVAGVKAVEEIRIRRKGWFDWKKFETLEYNPGPDTIIRVENNRLYPERGTLKIYIHGGA